MGITIGRATSFQAYHLNSKKYKFFIEISGMNHKILMDTTSPKKWTSGII